MPLTKLRNFLVPQDAVFFELMERQAGIAHEAAQELSALLRDYNGVAAKAAKIRELENNGDQLTREVYVALNKTFIVPIDHDDISALASSLDDALDMGLVKISVFFLALLVAKLWAPILSLGWEIYALIFVLAAIRPTYDVLLRK